MGHVYHSFEEAQGCEALRGRNRVYAVRDGDGNALYVVAVSPTQAMGEAGPEFGLRAELTDPQYAAARRLRTLEEWAAALPPAAKEALKRSLEEDANGGDVDQGVRQRGDGLEGQG